MPARAYTLVVPCYQEEAALACLEPVLAGLHAAEIVCVDDGSTDATARVLAGMAARDPRLRVVTHPHNLGVGAAMRTGLCAARHEVVVVYDADRGYPPEHVERLVAAVLAGADLATASPLAPEGRMDGVPAWRRALTRGAATSYRLVLGRRARAISTFTCAFRAYGPRARATCLPRADGFPAAAEMLGRALLAGLRVEELAAPLRPRTEGRSKMRVGRALLGHARALARLLALRLWGGGARAPGG
ncbi:MAG: glycosyltransferase family 2 protein [Planctomycetia bacterium]